MHEADRGNKNIIFWGTLQYAAHALRALIEQGCVRALVTTPSKAQGRGRRTIIQPPLQNIAEECNVPVLQPSDLDNEFRRSLMRFLPATFLLMFYGKYLPPAIVSLSQLPALNVHPSLLPRLRGPAPVRGALLFGLRQTGLTLMQIDDEMDHGPILAQKKVVISANDTHGTLFDKLGLAAAQFVDTYVPLYLAGALVPRQQDHARASYTKKISPADGVLPLEKDAVDLVNIVRAFSPTPGAFVLWRGKRLKILRARAQKTQGAGSTFFRSPSGQLHMTCARGSLEIHAVQLEGKRTMSATEFLNGHPEILAS